MFRIYYADGSTYSSDEGPPAAAPGYGVEVIVQPDKTPGVGNVGYVCLSGYDWYYWHVEDKEWGGSTGDASMWDLILHREPIVGICQGRRISRVRYGMILGEAAEWAAQQGLPSKSARQVGECAQW